MTEKKVNYKSTLNLPKTEFPMKANLPQREPETLRMWAREDIYGRIIAEREDSSESFILHDGPPYANGHIHMGHVLNKILKDICVKHFAMKGYYAPYIPGWDCHGMPIEHALFKELDISKHDIDQVEFRKKAYKYAMKFVRTQAREFKRLGIFGDWENPYLTLTRGYEADILASLADLCDKGYVYKDLKPVNWCKDCETALAEAEVEYAEKVSPSVFVKFDSGKTLSGKKVFFAIWTTTPWTLLANVAVALHPDYTYSFADTGSEVWVMDEDRAGVLLSKIGKPRASILKKLRGSDVVEEYGELKHPFIDRSSKLVTAEYVTKEDGTGCVHTAPGHGQDDYATGKEYGLPVIMPVDERGRFTRDTGEFEGREVIGANKDIIERLRSDGTLILSEEVTHAYPHCWRCKQPIIFRATEQWFLSIDHRDLRGRMEKAIEADVKWIPAMGRDRISAMVKQRPDWCLSRQRYWGVPIPAFKCLSCGEAFTGADIIRKVSDLTRRYGADVWFEKDIKELAGDVECPKCSSGDLKKENDILDVWFDSGVSHRAVLEAREELSFPADLYLEGSDQHRGWFQAALITSMASREEPPYKNVLTHGFVVDGEGKKMSKSVGNVISPEDVMKKYGADILRLWVSSSDYEGDVKLSSEILERLADGYRKIRNTYRFLLSNLNDFDPDNDRVPVEKMPAVDRWMLSRLAKLLRDIDSYYGAWEFHKVYRAVYDFCVYEVSSFYLDVSKDIVYILTPDSLERRSVQTVIFHMLDILVRIMAPVMPFTAEEVWGHISRKNRADSVHLAEWPDFEGKVSEWVDDVLDEKWKDMLAIRDKVMKMLELKRERGMIGSSLEAAITLYSSEEKMKGFLAENAELFPMLFKVSQAEVASDDGGDLEDVAGLPLKASVSKARGTKCQRCWNWDESVGTFQDTPDLCRRCYDVLSERSRNGQ